MPRPRKKQAEIVRRFGEKLREVRQSRGMTQADLAGRAGLAATHISELEGGDIAPGLDTVDRLATALGTTAAELLPSSDPADPLPVLKEQARELLEALCKNGGRDAFVTLNRVLALLVEAAGKRASSLE